MYNNALGAKIHTKLLDETRTQQIAHISNEIYAPLCGY